MSGRAPKQKGDRFEREIVNTLQEWGIGAERIPLSGAVGGSFAKDITVPVISEDWKGEAKCRKDGFAQLYRWIVGGRLLFLKRDRDTTLVVMRLDDFAKLALAVPGCVSHPPIARKLSLRKEPTAGEGYSG